MSFSKPVFYTFSVVVLTYDWIVREAERLDFIKSINFATIFLFHQSIRKKEKEKAEGAVRDMHHRRTEIVSCFQGSKTVAASDRGTFEKG
jgi:uncharacterized membrane protein (DUF106 family)